MSDDLRAMPDLTPAHVEAAHHVTVIQTDNPHAPLHLCSVCKAATYFQAPELPCPGPVVSLSDHDALLAALVRADVLAEVRSLIREDSPDGEQAREALGLSIAWSHVWSTGTTCLIHDLAINAHPDDGCVIRPIGSKRFLHGDWGDDDE